MSGDYKAPSNKMSPKEREMGGEDVSIFLASIKGLGKPERRRVRTGFR